MLLMDRSEDMVTPLLQNISYSSQYFNLLGNRDHILKFKIAATRGKQEEDGVSYLNENDKIWTSHKYRDYVEAMDMVVKEKVKFMEEHNSSGGGSDNILDQIRKAPELKEYLKDFNKHMETFGLIKDKAEESNLMQVLEYEQSLATGLTNKKLVFKPKDIYQSGIKNDFDRVRLGVLARMLHQADDSTLKNNIFDGKESILLRRVEEICARIESLTRNPPSLLRTVPEFENEARHYYRSRLAHIFYEKITGNLGEVFEEFDSKDFYPKDQIQKTFNNYIFKKNTHFESSCPIVIVFVKGGISYNEVMEINNLRNLSSLGDFIPICGGTNVYSAKTFVEALEFKKAEDGEDLEDD